MKQGLILAAVSAVVLGGCGLVRQSVAVDPINFVEPGTAAVHTIGANGQFGTAGTGSVITFSGAGGPGIGNIDIKSATVSITLGVKPPAGAALVRAQAVAVSVELGAKAKFFDTNSAAPTCSGAGFTTAVSGITVAGSADLVAGTYSVSTASLALNEAQL